MITASIVGASGYVGGELLRILLAHPEVEVTGISGKDEIGKTVEKIHPNLRGATTLKFTSINELPETDVLFSALPHGIGLGFQETFLGKADKIIDLSSDFRLKNKDDYPKWYNYEHPVPERLKNAVYGLPELHREELKKADYVAGPGCLATSVILGLKPIVENFKISNIIVDSKIGSAAAGLDHNLGTHHPERRDCVRSYKPYGHRHTAEMIQELNVEGKKISFTPHAIEMVRGILSTCHVFIEGEYEEKDVWKAYIQRYGKEPFVRFVKEKNTLHKYPEPKFLSGTNFCDIGFEKDMTNGRLIVMSAIDNICRGSAGQAVQCMNIMHGFNEKTGLGFMGLHPI